MKKIFLTGISFFKNFYVHGFITGAKSFISLVREISASKIKLCFPCGCSDIHINPTKCNVVVDTVLKHLGSPNLYSQACAGSIWKGVARCPLRGVLELSRISRAGCEPHDFHTTVLDYSPLHQETQQCCACFHSPQAPADALAPIPPAGHHSPAVPTTHPQQVLLKSSAG